MLCVCRFFTIVESLPGYEQKKMQNNCYLNYLNQTLEYPLKTVEKINTLNLV